MIQAVVANTRITNRMLRQRRFVTALALLVLAVVASAGVGSGNVASADTDLTTLPGSQGTDTSLPLTTSALSVPGRGRFGGAQVTVNQTANLTDQVVSITWSGADPTPNPQSLFESYFQIMQCWGDDDGSVPENPGPPPEQCVQGATTAAPDASLTGLPRGRIATTRLISLTSWPNYDPDVGHRSGELVWRPFRPVSDLEGEKEVSVPENPEYSPYVAGSQYWLNSFFNRITTNEIGGAVTRADGTGAELFQVLTGRQSSGLGCGQQVQPLSDGSKKVPQCWIVVVPRGTSLEENIGTSNQGVSTHPVDTSPLSPAAWANRIAIPISFNPVDSPCSIADIERRVVGSDLASGAVSSWQPALCLAGGLPPYSYAPVPDASARQQISNPTQGSPGLGLVSRPIAPEFVDPGQPVVYAPILASGIGIGFNIERQFLPIPQDVREMFADPVSGMRVAEINLTPRLVAKLLTQSYSGQLSHGPVLPAYEWLTPFTPLHLALDPDFLQFNPEFAILSSQYRREFSGLQVPAANSDVARQVWEWILADPEAQAWLGGEPDPWGMRVNDVYSTDPAVNPQGVAFGDPAPNLFPKSDPYCYQPPEQSGYLPPPLCGTDYMPYARSFSETAQRTRTAYDAARVGLNPFPLNNQDLWKTVDPQINGRRSFLSVTDTPSAALFGVQMANLSRAGDNGMDREFVAPNTVSLQAGLEAMAPGAIPDVLEPKPTGQPSGAYPLATITYGVIAPLGLDDLARAEYAAFIEYAAGPGQVQGYELGNLPPGYVPLPESLRSQALQVAGLVRDPAALEMPVATTTTQPAATVPTSTTVAPTASSTAAPVPGPVFAPSTGGSNSGSRGGTSSGGGNGAPSSSNVTSTTSPAAPTTPPAETDMVESTVPPATTEPTSVPTQAVPALTTPTTTTVPVLTPSTAAGPIRWAVPSVAGIGLLSALGALEITKRPRRSAKGGAL